MTLFQNLSRRSKNDRGAVDEVPRGLALATNHTQPARPQSLRGKREVECDRCTIRTKREKDGGVLCHLADLKNAVVAEARTEQLERPEQPTGVVDFVNQVKKHASFVRAYGIALP